MNWWQRWLGVTPQPTQEQTNLTEAAGGFGDDYHDADLEGYRPITQDSARNLSPLTQERMRKVAYKLWEANLLANRIVEIPVAYILAEGCSLSHSDEQYQDVLDRFWKDPINRMSRKLPKRARELFIDGELFMPAFTNEHTGAVRLALLSADLVAEIVYDPDNPEEPIGVITKRDTKGQYRKYRVIINGAEDCFTQRTQTIRQDFTDGDIFYFHINSLGIRARGRSKLLAPADHLDSYENFLFSEAERADFLRAFVWHFQVEGADQDAIKNTWLPMYRQPPRPGSTQVTNEKVKINPVTPQLNSEDTEKLARLLRNHSLGGSTIPEHVFGGGGDVNRATGDSMMEPFEKVLTMDQTTVSEILMDIGIYVLRQHELNKAGGKEPDLNHPIYDMAVNMPEMTAKDTSKLTSALQQLANFSVSLINARLLTRETALRFISLTAAKLGVDFDAKKELEAAQQEHKQQTAKQDSDDVYQATDDDNPAQENADAAV
ncbi:hypothetical protein [Bowmanella denitrificans]|uniref:hypothetical protein n=1 Tax=Bowmanella denitrificans TaxID=366582 RepID=UPI0011AF6D5E|nr:hypothetical protein [Bowmanella denitrificans]